MSIDNASPMTVLVVDDSLELQQSIATLLEPVGGVRIVGFARDCSGALSMVDSLHPDLMVLDIALRGTDSGIDVLRHVVAHHRHTKVIVLSNMTWRAMRRVWIEAGAHAYFDKGDEFIQAREFIAALARVHAATRDKHKGRANG